jgi:hypothetical protein
MASLFEPVCRCPAVEQWTPLMAAPGRAHAKANAYCCGQIWNSMVRHNQVGVQDQRWPPPPADNIHHGHSGEQITRSMSKTGL